MSDLSLSSEERQKIRFYFLNLRWWVACGLLFAGLVIIDTCPGMALALIGLVWLLGALWIRARKPKAEEIEELFSKELRALVPKAIGSFDTAEEELVAAPLSLWGPTEPGDLAAGPSPARQPAVRIARSPVHRAVILLPMEDHLGIFS